MIEFINIGRAIRFQIKHWPFYTLLLLFFLFSLTNISRAELSWTPLTSGTTQWLYDVHFVDKNTGYVVGNAGTILTTTDGGKTWVALTTGTSVNLRSVHFADANNGFAAGANKTIIKTTNGGLTWNVVNAGGQYSFYGIHFPADSTTGYTVGKTGMVKTTNGGATWSALTIASSDVFYTVHFTDTNTGYAVGDAGKILKTTDGGATSSTLTSGTTQTLYSVHFPVDANTGYVVGCGGTILKTTNGGTTWTPQISGTAICLNAVHFPKDANTGYVVGEGGVILKTTDGGSTWTAQTSGTTLWLRSAYFTDENTGFAVSDNGTILGMGDATPPSDIAYVHDGISDDIQFTNSSDTLSANWASSSDSETGIAKYYYAIGTTSGATDVLNWTDNGTATTVTKTGLMLTHGATYYFSAKVENGGGLQSGITSSDGQLAYFIPPALTITAPANNYLTSNPSLTVIGTAETGSAVTVKGTAVNVDSSTGAFTTPVTLQEGTDTITAVATKYSLATTVTRTVTLDTTPPALTLTAPQENVVVSTSPVNVAGSTEAGVALKINNADTTVNSDGSFSTPLNLIEGENTITATATDPAGNQTTVTRKITYSPNALFLTVDVPQDNTYTNNATQTVSGKTDPYAALTVNGQNTSVNSNGAFSTTTALSKGTNTITVTATLQSADTLQATVTRTVIYDPDAPELAIETKADSSSTPSRPVVKITLKSNETLKQTPSVTVTNTQTGNQTMVKMTSAGNESKEFTGTFDIGSSDVFKGTILVEAYDLSGNKGALEAPLVNYNSQSGNDATLSDDSAGMSLYLPANALPVGTSLMISTTGETPDAQGELQPAGKEVLIETTTTSTLTTNATLTLDYDESASLTDENKLRIYTYNETSQKWEYVGGTVNSATNEVTVQVSHFSKYAVFADTSAPQISSLTPSEGTNTETNTTFTATLSDSGSGIDASGFTAKIDGTAFSSSAYSYNAATGALSVSAANLSESAHTFTLEVKDNTGNSSSASRSITAYSAFTGGLSSGLILVSFPFTPLTTDIASLLGVSSDTVISYWDASQKKYVSYPDASTAKASPGEAYWLKLSSSLSPRVLGNMVSSSGDYSVALKSGWNMFGNPFNFNVNLSDINVKYLGSAKTLEEAAAAGWLGKYAYTYGGASTGYQLVHPTAADAKRVLEPWKGYWMHSAKDVELLIPPTKSSLSKADAAVTGAGNFSVTLKISDGSTTTNLVAGRSSKSEMLSLPPDNPETTAGALTAFMTKNGSYLYADFNDSLSYTFSVAVKSGAAVTIGMENNGLPQDYFVYLTDAQNNKETLLSKTNYTFTGDGSEKSFTLSITKADKELFSQPLSLENVVIFPNPVKNTIGISAPVNITGKFSAGLPVLSEIEIYSLTGKLLHKESSAVSYGGKGKVKVDSSNTGNIFAALPNGVYVVRISFYNARGEKTSKIAKLSVAR